MKWSRIRKSKYRAQCKALILVIQLGFLGLLLLACEPVENKNKVQRDGNSGAVSISGTIFIAPGSMIDSDVNDVNASYIANDSIAQAQSISNPVTLGGYVNVPDAGSVGRSYRQGDVDDYYVAQLFARQTVTISVSDYDKPPAGGNVIVLQLLNENGDVIGLTTGNGSTETITINSDGIYYIKVHAVAGASNYMLNVGLSNQQEQGSNDQGNEDLNINTDFVPGEVIVELGAQSQISSQAVTIESSASAIGLQAKAGAPGRSILMSVGSGLNRQNALSALGVQVTPQGNNEILQRKMETLEIIKVLRKRDDIKSARPNYIRRALLEPNDEFYTFQWHYPQINLPQAWDVETGRGDVVVAVIDTGVLLDHPDLQGQLVAGYDFIRNAASAADGDGIDNNPDDVGDDANGNSSFHGTHVSGTIAAAANNGVGVAGIAWGSKIMPLRALGRFGGTDYDIEQAVRYAAQLPNDSNTIPPQKADVINLSLGGPTNSTIAPTAFRQARAAGVIIIAAAGNNASSGVSYPASLDGVVSVSAVGINQNLASYSNFGATIDISSPGGEFTDLNGDGFIDGVLSTAGSDAEGVIRFGYAFYQGTSMAAPHVAGVAALMKSINPQLSPADFDELLVSGAITKDIGQRGRDDLFGYGLVDAYKAVNAAKGLVDEPLEPRSPVAEVSPVALNFGSFATSIAFNIINVADGQLNVVSVTNNSSGWLSVTEDSVNGQGLGSYTASVNRSLLPSLSKTYTAIIRVETSVNIVNVPVIMQIVNNDFVIDAGLHYVELQDSVSSKTLRKVRAQLSQGKYTYLFNNVPVGSYTIIAGTDSDADSIICEAAEACGTYLMPTHVLNVEVDGRAGDKSNINFETSFDNVLSTADDITSEKRFQIKMGRLLD
ncbi:MAG: S8 family serine peptidase [Gammaproteobacteria bacterium]|nr:S8 family serine peptidase [Gammaproteobacteria bacterium]